MSVWKVPNGNKEHILISPCLIRPTCANSGFLFKQRDQMRNCLMMMRNGFRSQQGDVQSTKFSIMDASFSVSKGYIVLDSSK